MGQPRRDNPNHPVNRARLLHAAWLKIHKPGDVIPGRLWRRSVLLATGAGTQRTAYNQTSLMQDLGMVRAHDGEGIELLDETNVLLPD